LFANYARELTLDPMNFAVRMAAKFGGIAEIPLAGRNSLFLLSDPDLIRETLIDKRTLFIKNTRYDALRRLLGNGMLLSEHEAWRRQRRLLQPAFKPGVLAGHHEWLHALIDTFLDRWQDAARTQAPVNMMVEFQKLAQAVAGRLTFGVCFEGRADALFDTLMKVWRSWPARPSLATWIHWQRTRERAARLDAAMAELDALMLSIIDACREAGPERGGLIGLLIRASAEEGPPFTPMELRDQAITMIGAGYETSASAMCWTHILLAQHPDIRERIEAEVAAHCPPGAPISLPELEALTYTEQVVKESLRLYLPIHSFARVATEDTSIGGCPVAKGKTAVVSVHAMHHTPQHWPEPDRFDPERFGADQCAGRSRYTYLPFGLGHRACIGATFAMTEAVLTVALIARRYRLELVPGQVFEPAPGTTVYPRQGLKMTVHGR
jgi:cytochrome P450